MGMDALQNLRRGGRLVFDRGQGSRERNPVTADYSVQKAVA